MAGNPLAALRPRARGIVLAALVLLSTVLAACGTGASGVGGRTFPLLVGSTSDHPAQPPVIAANGPAGTYAFVYDNQIWLRRDGETQAKQLTHMTFSATASIAWGPLVWSSDGRYIAFTVVENTSPAGGSATGNGFGPLYYLDLATDPATLATSAGTGSVYGHSYTWFGDSILLYSNGSGIQMYTVGSADPRAWQVLDLPALQGNGTGQAGYAAFGDIQVSGADLYYTREDTRSLGVAGPVGNATLYRTQIGTPGDYAGLDASALAGRLPLDSGDPVTTLGQVYSPTGGTIIAGAWQIADSQLALQRVLHVDVTAKTATSQLCILAVPAAAQSDDGCDVPVLDGASIQPLTVRPQLAFGGGDMIAYNGEKLYLSGGRVVALASGSGWPVPPVWTPDGQLVATQIASTKVDGGGVTRITTNIILISDDGHRTVLIAGAQNIAWRSSFCGSCPL